MKSKKVKELMDWLGSRVRSIDIPRDYSSNEVTLLVEIAELENSAQLTKNAGLNESYHIEKLEEKVKEFKKIYS